MHEILIRLDQSDSMLFIPDNHQQSHSKKLSITIPAYNEANTIVAIAPITIPTKRSQNVTNRRYQ